MARLALHLFGGFEVRLDGVPVTAFEYDKVRALLAYLVLEPPVLRDRDALAGLLWPEQRAEDARQSLRQALYRLRAALADDGAGPGVAPGVEPLLLTTRTGVQRNPAADLYCDVLAFDALLASRPDAPPAKSSGPGGIPDSVRGGDAADVSAASSVESGAGSDPRLAQAVELYRGELLYGLALAGTVEFEDWLLLKREHYARLALDALAQLARRRAGQGDYQGALAYAQRQVALAPWQEEAHRQVMDLLAHAGQRSAALRQYELCRRALKEELGVEPSLETRRLYLRIKAPVHRRLPAQATPFVGRRQELAGIVRQLADPSCRLITIAGLGGMGKTRLAVAAAFAAGGENGGPFLHGVAFVPLAGIDRGREIVSTIARSLDYHFSGPEPEQAQLLSYLRDRELLLVLDNFEQLIGTEARALLRAILDAAPGVKLMVTSRERLAVPGEHLLLLDGLPVGGRAPAEHGAPDASAMAGEQNFGDAVRLFLDAARRAGASARGAPEDVAAAARICTLVGGMPLAIELAAGWSTALSPAEIAAELAGCLDLLSSEERDLRAVFDATWSRLAERERSVLRMLSVFRDGFSREAAEAVAAASSRDLLALAERSLVRRGDGGRFAVHELLRQYGLERLAVEPALLLEARDRHAAYFVHFLVEREARMTAGDTVPAADEVSTEIENVRAAWLWAAERGRSDWMEQAAWPLSFYHELRSQYEEAEALWAPAEESLQRALALTPEGSPAGAASSGAAHAAARDALALVLAVDAFATLRRGRVARARELAERSLALRGGAAEPRRSVVLGLYSLGNIAMDAGQVDAAGEHYREAHAVARSLGDAWLMSLTPGFMALPALASGDLPQARRLLLESLHNARRLGKPWQEAIALSNLAEVAHRQGDYREALRLARESGRLAAAFGSRYSRVFALVAAARAERKLGAGAEARRELAEGLGVAVSDADALMLLGELAGVLHEEGLRQAALDLLAFVLAHPALRPVDRPDVERVAAELSVAPGSEEWTAAQARAAGYQIEDFIALYAA